MKENKQYRTEKYQELGLKNKPRDLGKDNKRLFYLLGMGSGLLRLGMYENSRQIYVMAKKEMYYRGMVNLGKSHSNNKRKHAMRSRSGLCRQVIRPFVLLLIRQLFYS